MGGELNFQGQLLGSKTHKCWSFASSCHCIVAPLLLVDPHISHLRVNNRSTFVRKDGWTRIVERIEKEELGCLLTLPYLPKRSVRCSSVQSWGRFPTKSCCESLVLMILFLPMSSSLENLSGLAIGGPALPGVAGAPPGAGLPWLPARWLR